MSIGPGYGKPPSSIIEAMSGSGWKEGLSAASPLLLAMSSDLMRGTPGASTQQGLAGMMQMQQRREQQTAQAEQAQRLQQAVSQLPPAIRQQVAGLPMEQQAQALSRLATQQTQTSEWERMTQGMDPAQVERARMVKLGLEPDADTALRVGASQQPQPGFRRATEEEAAQYGGPGQIGPDGRFYPLKNDNGMTVFGPDGQPIMTTGNPQNVKPFTEGQSKDNVYVTRARGALKNLEPVAGALTSVTDRALGADPTGLLRERFQSDDFQLAEQAGQEYLQAILRKDTGAAITSQEQVLYGGTYLPQPGDKEAVLKQKADARQRAVAAMESGMSPLQMVAVEKALQRGDITPEQATEALGGQSSGAAPQPPAPPQQLQGLSDDDLMRMLQP